jgi:hypothetical protein
VLVAQAFRIDRDNPAVESEMPAPAEVRAALRHACYDCHSNETVWPWYACVAPVSWVVSHDVHDGRRAVNFSTWGTYRPAPHAKLLRESVEEVTEGDMPPWYYRVIHPEARLTADEIAALGSWARKNAGQ